MSTERVRFERGEGRTRAAVVGVMAAQPAILPTESALHDRP